MASLPPQQPSQRRSSPEQTSPNQSQSQAPSSPARSRTEESQTLFTNSADKENTRQDSQSQQAHAQNQDPNDTEPKKCWICFSDSTEDTPETSPWRDPCPCALVAHEECLLDWIADMEAPNNRRNRSVGAPKIECPQCKSEIKLARPRNLVVEAVRGMERLGSQMITPGALTVLVGTVYHSSMAWGVHSIYSVFGPEDGFRILRPLILNTVRPPIDSELNGTAREIGLKLLTVAADHLVHWRLYIGLPLITPILVLSRTSLADSVLPVLPILFFATQTHSSQDTLDFGQWPPSASLAFAVLPYLRSAYNAYYRKVWAEREKQWLKEIQPRVSQNQNDGNAEEGEINNNQGGQNDEDDNVFEVRIDGGIWEDWDEEDEEAIPELANAVAQHQAAQQQPAENNAEAQQGEQPQPQPNQPNAENRDGQPQPHDHHHHHHHHHQPAAGAERRLSFSPTVIAETVLGALVFPTIASLSGELLKLALPKSWTTPPPPSKLGFRIAAKGLLQEKWGRSLVGGCLFVVLKDAVMLYVRWKMVRMHRMRRVLDFERKGKAKA